MSTTHIGNRGEQSVENYLISKNYQILDRNWKTKICEVDIIAQKNHTVFFVEVKYRQSSEWGDGLEYIDKRKLKQMIFAAQLWVQKHRYLGEWTLAAAEVGLKDYKLLEFVELFGSN